MVELRSPKPAARVRFLPPLIVKNYSKNIQTVLDILQDEVNGNVAAALQKMTDDYTMTWVDLGVDGKEELFPTTGNDMKKELEEAYPIKGRKYEIKNIAEGDEVVMVELIESYPDPKTGEVYRAPLVLVLEMQDGKIRTGRHYLDPRIAKKHLSENEIEKAYKNSRDTVRVIR